MKGNKFKLERPKITKESRKGVSSSSAPRPPWVELPRDVTANILQRLGAIEILESAQRVCTTWRSVCLEPSMWRVIDMRNLGDLHDMPYDLEIMCLHAVDRSQGQLIEINIENFGTYELIHYITERSPLLKHLKLANCYNIEGEELSDAVKKIPQLEELHLTYMTSIDADYIEFIGRSCPMLKSFTYNYRWYNHNYPFPEDSEAEEMEYAQAVAKTMPNLRHLALLGDKITNERLHAILDNCPHLESLDIRQCKNIDLRGDLEKRLSMQIKTLRRPSDSTVDYGWIVNDDDRVYNYPENLHAEQVEVPQLVPRGQECAVIQRDMHDLMEFLFAMDDRQDMVNRALLGDARFDALPLPARPRRINLPQQPMQGPENVEGMRINEEEEHRVPGGQEWAAIRRRMNVFVNYWVQCLYVMNDRKDILNRALLGDARFDALPLPMLPWRINLPRQPMQGPENVEGMRIDEEEEHRVPGGQEWAAIQRDVNDSAQFLYVMNDRQDMVNRALLGDARFDALPLPALPRLINLPRQPMQGPENMEGMRIDEEEEHTHEA